MSNHDHPPAGDPGASPEHPLLPSVQDVTLMLTELTGDAVRAEELLPVLYEDLRRLAASTLSKERKHLTLDATSLVHEAYLRLTRSTPDQPWAGRGQFFSAAAITMRRILIERARKRARLRHGGGRSRVDLDDDSLRSTPAQVDAEELLSLDEALTELERASPRRAQVVMLRYFTGLTIEETAAALNIAPATVKQDWAAARAWLRRRMESGPQPRPAAEDGRGDPPV